MELTGKRYGRSDWRKLMSTRRGTILVALAATITVQSLLAASRPVSAPANSKGGHR